MGKRNKNSMIKVMAQRPVPGALEPRSPPVGRQLLVLPQLVLVVPFLATTWLEEKWLPLLVKAPSTWARTSLTGQSQLLRMLVSGLQVPERMLWTGWEMPEKT